MTSVQGSGVRGSRKPSRKGFLLAIDGLDGVASKLISKRGVDLGRERLVLARGEPREERECDRRRRYRLVDRLEDGPAALAGVVDVAADLLQTRILVEREHEQVEEPAAHDRAVLPEP